MHNIELFHNAEMPSETAARFDLANCVPVGSHLARIDEGGRSGQA